MNKTKRFCAIALAAMTAATVRRRTYFVPESVLRTIILFYNTIQQIFFLSLFIYFYLSYIKLL